MQGREIERSPVEYQLAQGLEILERTPSVLRAWLGGLSEPWVRGRYGPDTFSPFDVVGHLICGERKDWITRARIILEEGEGRAFDPFDRYGMYEENRDKDLAELLDTFEGLRRENLSELRSWGLGPEELARTGLHPALGVVTLEALLATWTVHDLAHLAQIARAMSHQYRERVGAWEEYLSILRR